MRIVLIIIFTSLIMVGCSDNSVWDIKELESKKVDKYNAAIKIYGGKNHSINLYGVANNWESGDLDSLRNYNEKLIFNLSITHLIDEELETETSSVLKSIWVKWDNSPLAYITYENGSIVYYPFNNPNNEAVVFQDGHYYLAEVNQSAVDEVSGWYKGFTK